MGTGLSCLDEFFDGKIPDGILVDVFGPSAIGKTQLAMQISVNTVSETNKILFQDTTGAFRPERMLEMLRSNNLPTQYLNNVSVSRITNVSEQLNILSTIDPSQYSLIVIDGISELFSFEYGNPDQFFEKNRLFLKYIRSLSSYALENKITILFTNVMRTIDDKQVENNSQILDMFTHVKIKLEKVNDCSYFTCFTAFDKIRFPFQIMSPGLVRLP